MRMQEKVQCGRKRVVELPCLCNEKKSLTVFPRELDKRKKVHQKAMHIETAMETFVLSMLKIKRTLQWTVTTSINKSLSTLEKSKYSSLLSCCRAAWRVRAWGRGTAGCPSCWVPTWSPGSRRVLGHWKQRAVINRVSVAGAVSLWWIILGTASFLCYRRKHWLHDVQIIGQ